jgi:hypothetical protein
MAELALKDAERTLDFGAHLGDNGWSARRGDAACRIWGPSIWLLHALPDAVSAVLRSTLT